MKSRFLFAPIPILIVGTLLGLDFWSGGHWGIYLLITATSASCVYEMGAAYSGPDNDVPYGFLTVGTALLMLTSGYVFLFPERVSDTLLITGINHSTLALLSFLFSLLVVNLMVVLYRIQSNDPEQTDSLLIGLGLFNLFSVTYVHVFVLLSLLSDRSRLGTLVIIFLMLVCKGADSGSYLVGKTFGSYQMSPQLSPNKTWMGLFGGMFSGVLIGGLFYGTRLGELTSLPSLLIISFILSLAAAAGDLIGSLLKRGAGVDDSSNMFPGLGGLTDMTDSFLVTIPVALLILFLLS